MRTRSDSMYSQNPTMRNLDRTSQPLRIKITPTKIATITAKTIPLCFCNVVAAGEVPILICGRVDPPDRVALITVCETWFPRLSHPRRLEPLPEPCTLGRKGSRVVLDGGGVSVLPGSYIVGVAPMSLGCARNAGLESRELMESSCIYSMLFSILRPPHKRKNGQKE